ncbi:MAG: M20/M25/M40 family metallo-hydrolase [Vicinamibacterales bacterium]
MMRSLAAVSLLLFVSFIPLSGTPSAPASDDALLAAADLAWERGDYPAALAGYLELLDSSDAASVLEPIALRTGELYQTTELTRDGALPQFSPDGRHILYEHGPITNRVTRLAATAEPTRTIAELRGTGASFSPDSQKIAYWKLQPAPGTGDSSATTAKATLREIESGRESTIDTGVFAAGTLLVGAGDTIILASLPVATSTGQLHVGGQGRALAAITTDQTDKIVTALNSTGTALIFTSRAPGGRGGRGAPAPAGGRGAGGPAAPPSFSVLSIPDGRVANVVGAAPSFSADGRTIVFVRRSAEESSLMTVATADPAAEPSLVRKGPERVDAPALSADAARVAFQMMLRDDWEIVTVNRDGTGESRLTHDIQHDLLPAFLTDTRLLGLIGEPRHRRSFLYDLQTGSRTRLFHNNTVRTIAPEYLWKPSPDGSKVLIVAERDGDTVSPERGVYLMDLTKTVTRQDVRARVAASLAAEEALRTKGARAFAPIADAVKAMTSSASVDRIYGYEKALFDFDSKHISRPGNKLASAYLFETYRSFGYTPEFQWFERPNALGGQTANVIATLKGTVNPELIYVVSSHYDSVAIGPGADDDSSGTAALLETARIMARHPQPATIVFASFTGEEAGLLGSREFVRRAVADKLSIVGALNNDMVGWANDQRLDNTIRYSNPGIRDVQHAAAMQFSNLITYDALYYKGTDAAAYYEAFGDIVGGIGSYPVLSSPHYHQSHDVLENMNHQLITEVAKTTAATLALLASSPSRLTELKADLKGSTATISWKPSPESGVTGYLVVYGPAGKPDAHQLRVTTPTAVLKDVAPGSAIAVKAVNSKGLEGWDWARVVVK